MCNYSKEKLEGIQLFTLAQLHQRTMACESQNRDTPRLACHNINLVDYYQNSLDDETKHVYVAEIVWPAKAEPSSCSSLQPLQKNRPEEMKLTFNVAKCDKIFYELVVTSR
jgi:hypothetical protein